LVFVSWYVSTTISIFGSWFVLASKMYIERQLRVSIFMQLLALTIQFILICICFSILLEINIREYRRGNQKRDNPEKLAT